MVVFFLADNKAKDIKMKMNHIGNIYKDGWHKGYAGDVWNTNGIIPALRSSSGGGKIPLILVKANTKVGFEEANEGDYINLSFPKSETRRGRVGHGVAQTIQSSRNEGGGADSGR